MTISLFALISCKEDKTNEEKEIQESSFYETELTLTPDSVNLYGTLSMPDSTGQYPLVIIIAGSGPTDRNGNSVLGITAKPYQLIADTLVKCGIATFRFDKRGIAKSVAKGMKEEDLSFDCYVNDVVFIINEFKKDKRFNKIILLGHSEGALIGAIAANLIEIDKYISVSGISRPADSVLIEQLSHSKEVDLEEAKRIIEEIKKGNTTKINDVNLVSIFRLSVQPYLASWFKYNPKTEYAKLTIPVLILHGTTDIQIPLSDAEQLAKVTQNAKLVVLEHMNHVLKDAPADTLKNAETYNNPDLPVYPKLIEEIVKFVKE